MEGLGELIANLLVSALEGISYAGGWRHTPPALPTEPTALELMAMVFGVFVVFLELMGLGVFVHQWTSERLVLRETAAPAVIVSIERRQSGSDGYADVRLDYQRQSPFGPVACRRASARLRHGSQDLKIGQTVAVYPQPASCSQPIYAPDIGSPQRTLWASLMTFPVGTVMVCGGYSSMRRRQRQLAMMGSAAKSAAAAT